MIQSVEEHCAELELFAFGDGEALDHRKIEVVDASQRHRVPAAIGVCTRTSLDISRIRIAGQVSYGLACAVMQSRDVRTDVFISGGIDDDPVAGTVAIQIGIGAALDGC